MSVKMTMESVRMTLADFFADNDPFTSCPSVCDAETQANITAFLQRRTPTGEYDHGHNDTRNCTH